MVSVRDGGEIARLEVADRGPGIPAELRERIFERFAHAGDSPPTAGSGLGLAIVRAVAESHGGSVEAREAPGGGALFAVTLPAAEALQSSGAGVGDEEAPTAVDPKGAKAK